MSLVVAAADGDERHFLAAEFVEVDGGHRIRGDAGDDESAAAGDGVAGGFERAVLGGAVEGYVDSSVVGAGTDAGEGFGGGEDGVGSVGEGHGAAVGDGVDGENAADALEFQHGDGQDADGSASPDGSGFSRGGAGEVERMEGDGEGLKERAFGEAEADGEGEDVVGWEVDDVTEEAGVGAGAIEANMVAEVMTTGAAHGAVVAVDGGFEDDAFAGADNGAGGFMA